MSDSCPIGSASLLRVGWESPALPAWNANLRVYLLEIGRALQVEPGDVVAVPLLPGATDLEQIKSVIVGSDIAVRRDETITDMYQSEFGDDALATLGTPAMHVQLRQFRLGGADVLQVAIYPQPPVVAEVRTWCEAAVVWLFYSPGVTAEFENLLVAIQPLWERLRAHHGIPLNRTSNSSIRTHFPVGNTELPISSDTTTLLHAAIVDLSAQDVVDALAEATTPRSVVYRTLAARREVLRHLRRLDKVLFHTHGNARAKFTSLESTARELVTEADQLSLGHLLAPHRHLVDGFEETRRDLAELASTATETAELITSAAVTRLLDRSEANRQASTVFAVCAFVFALTSVFTALAAIPGDNRLIPDLVVLGGAVGLAAVAIALLAYAIGYLAYRPTPSLGQFLTQHRAIATTTSILIVLVGLTWAAMTGTVAGLLMGGFGVLVTVFVQALADDY